MLQHAVPLLPGPDHGNLYVPRFLACNNIGCLIRLVVVELGRNFATQPVVMYGTMGHQQAKIKLLVTHTPVQTKKTYIG